MTPIIFFTFENLSCIASAKGKLFESDQCDNTLTAALWLSLNAVIIIIVSIANEAVSKDEKGEEITYKNLVMLRLKKRQKIQGALGVVTVMTSMYSFSVSGVQGDQDYTIYVVGGAGTATLIIAGLIEMFTLAFGESRGGEQSTWTSEAPEMSEKSTYKVTKDYFAGKDSALKLRPYLFLNAGANFPPHLVLGGENLSLPASLLPLTT